MGMEQVNQQQLAVLSNLSSVESLDLLIKSELDKQNGVEQKNLPEESILRKILDGKGGSKVGVDIVAGLIKKLAAQVLPADQILGNLQNDYSEFLNALPDDPGDLAEIRDPSLRLIKPLKKFTGQQSADGSGLVGPEEGEAASQAAPLKQYISGYAQFLVAGGGELKKKLDRLENQLLQDKGVTLKDLQGIKLQVAGSVRTEVLQQVKNAFLKQIVAKDGKTIEGILAGKETQNYLDFLFTNDQRVGSFSLGGRQAAVDGAFVEVVGELRDFVDDSLTEQVIKKGLGEESFGQEKKMEKEIDELLKLGKKIGFNINDFLQKMPQIKENLGLNPIINFEYAPADAGANSDQGRRHRYQYTPDEEKEILTDKLRALFLKQAVAGGGLRTVLETQFKMIKLKNGLIKLGLSNFDEVEKQGQAIAKIKLVQMLREGFEERATYAKLSGPAWQMTQKKVKTVLRNLEKLGVNLSEAEVNFVRDHANHRMFEEAAHELEMVKTAIEARGEMAYLTQKKKMLQEIIGRLAEESQFQRPGEELNLIKEAA